MLVCFRQGSDVCERIFGGVSEAQMPRHTMGHFQMRHTLQNLGAVVNMSSLAAGSEFLFTLRKPAGTAIGPRKVLAIDRLCTVFFFASFVRDLTIIV
jgi:hypothetical protein